MGQAESTPGGGPSSSSSSHDPSLPANTVAFHVLRVAENSPAANAGLDPFFDFIVGVNGTQLGEDIDTFTQILEENEGRQVTLMVYSTKRKEIRDVPVVPSSEWSSNGVQAASVDDQPSLLGLSLRLCNPQHALEQVWHVLEVLEGSPAQSAGLVPFGDWIIGYSGGVLRGEGDFYDVVESHTDKSLRLFVYNSDYDVTRETILVPNRTWGGEGLLGAGVGYGLLHRIPKPQDRPRVNSDHEPPKTFSAPTTQNQSQPQNQFRPPPPPASSSSLQQQPSQYRSPPRTSTSISTSSNLVSPPPPPRSSISQSQVQSSVPPPPPRRTAAVSPPPPVTRSKYIPPPPPSSSSGSVTSPTRTSQNRTIQNNYSQQQQQYPSKNLSQSGRGGGGGETSISFGEYGGTGSGSEGVEIIPTREEEEQEENEGYSKQQQQQSFSSPQRYSSYGGGGGASGSPYRNTGLGRQTAIIEE
ncbi:hypothetical protein JCM5350_003477 [Sporobolomyces pararoseus]